MEQKEQKDEREEAEQDESRRVVELSASFSKNRYAFYHYLRMLNSVIITSTALWYTHYFLIRSDEDKIYSYFIKKPSGKQSSPSCAADYLFTSKPRELFNKITNASLLFCLVSNLLLKFKRRSLSKLLSQIRGSHSIKKKKQQKKMQRIYMRECDLELLNKWKCLLGGNRYYLGNLNTAILCILSISLISENTWFGSYQAMHQREYYLRTTAANESAASSSPSAADASNEWTSRYYQYSGDKQEIQWLSDSGNDNVNIQEFPVLDLKQLNGLMFRQIAVISCWSLMFTFSMFPVSALCALNVLKCGMSAEHKRESENWVWYNKWICWIAFSKGIAHIILNKSYYSRYLNFREVVLSTEKSALLNGGKKLKKKANEADIAAAAADRNNNDNNGNDTENNRQKKKRKKVDEKLKLERKLRAFLSVRVFSYDIVQLCPWICLYFSVKCATSSTYYIKTFASTSAYDHFSKRQHEKNKAILKVIGICSLMMGICIGIGSDTYLESVNYAKRWFLPTEKFSVESYQTKLKVKQMLHEDREEALRNTLARIDEAQQATPGHVEDEDVKDKEELNEDVRQLVNNEHVNEILDRNQSINTTTDEESDQVEGADIKTRKNSSKYTELQRKLIHGDYQKDSEMMLSSRYLKNRAHDLFEYVAEICVFLEDKFFNSVLIPVY